MTVRSAKSPRLTSPPPIVSMMKTSEEKPKEPGRGRGGKGRRGAGREKERQKEAEGEIRSQKETGRDRQGRTDKKRGRQTDRQTFGTGRLQTRGQGFDPEDTEALGLALQPPSAMDPGGLGRGGGAAYLRVAGAGVCQEGDRLL